MPLPLDFVAFEDYMLTDDRDSHPMTFTVRMHFSGRFDRERFEKAVLCAVERHPLFRARLEQIGRHNRWVASEDPRPWIAYVAPDEPLRYPGSERIDLTRENGLRIWVRGPRASGDAQSTEAQATKAQATGPKPTEAETDAPLEMRIQFHHCCTDGIGAYRFIEDLLCAYELEVHGDRRGAAFRALDPQLLKRRTKFGLSRWQSILRFPQEMWGIIIGLPLFFLKRPIELETPDPVAGPSVDPLELLDYPVFVLDEQESRNLRQAGKSLGGTLTDVMLRDMFMAMHAWNVKLRPGSKRRMQRVMMPFSLRGTDDEEVPATNIVAMAMVDRRPWFHRSPRRLLRGIVWETKILKRFRLAISFVRACGIFRHVPGGMELLARANRCYTSTVLSNMGVALYAAQLPREGNKLLSGDLMLEAIQSAPPVRPFTATSLTSVSYAGRLTMVVNFDRYHLTPEVARQFTETLGQRMRASAASAASGEDATG
jgi:hypothetical protein